MLCDLFERRAVVDKFAVLKDRLHKLYHFVVVKSGLLPSLLGMEDSERLPRVKNLIFKADEIRLSHAVLQDPNDFFHAGICGLFMAVGHFDARLKFAVFFYRAEFVYATERSIVITRDKFCANAVHIYLCILVVECKKYVFYMTC